MLGLTIPHVQNHVIKGLRQELGPAPNQNTRENHARVNSVKLKDVKLKSAQVSDVYTFAKFLCSPWELSKLIDQTEKVT